MEEINDKEPYIVRLNLYKVSKIGKFIENKNKPFQSRSSTVFLGDVEK